MKRLSEAALDAVGSLPNTQDIARYFGVSPRTVDRWRAEKRIPFLALGHRTIRYRWKDVEAALERHKIQEIR